ncbi:MAG: hypothetical protein FWC20_09080, partial [Oscillospiraceae bacterium]|nr:hypothetical protein [Oscillospiraceae bacterium]MCL2279542.1 hypothetical protein [Oscillospiraceae bacterium]
MMGAITKFIESLHAGYYRAVKVLPQSARPFLYYTPFKLYRIFFDYSVKKSATRNCETPTEQMLQSKDFFSANKDRFDNVASLLIDDVSKDCYKKMIDFRCNSNLAEFPQVTKVQYFDDEFFTYGDSEVYVDCGAFNGDSIMQFKHTIKKIKKNYAKIIAFEPGAKYDILTNAHNDVIAINAGVWKQNDTLVFSNAGASTKIIGDEDTTTSSSYDPPPP